MDTSEAGAPSTYEFNDAENETIGKAARWIGFWAWVAIGTGVVSGLAALMEQEVGGRIGGLIAATIYVMIGFFFQSAAGSMKSVVVTIGDDITHLMSALDRLAAAFKIMGILVIVLVVAILLLLMVAGGGMVASGG